MKTAVAGLHLKRERSTHAGLSGLLLIVTFMDGLAAQGPIYMPWSYFSIYQCPTTISTPRCRLSAGLSQSTIITDLASRVLCIPERLRISFRLGQMGAR